MHMQTCGMMDRGVVRSTNAFVCCTIWGMSRDLSAIDKSMVACGESVPLYTANLHMEYNKGKNMLSLCIDKRGYIYGVCMLQ